LGQWLLWVALSAVGLTIGVTIPETASDPRATLALFLLLPGLASGIAQWAFLRSLHQARFWILATAATYPLICFAFLSLAASLAVIAEDPALQPPPVTFLLLSSLLALPAGTAQSLVLRWSFHRSSLWIPATYVGWALGFLSFTYVPAIALSTTAAFMGATQSAITGVALLALKPKAPRQFTGA